MKKLLILFLVLMSASANAETKKSCVEAYEGCKHIWNNNMREGEDVDFSLIAESMPCRKLICKCQEHRSDILEQKREFDPVFKGLTKNEIIKDHKIIECK